MRGRRGRRRATARSGASATRVVDNNDAITGRGPGRLALTSLSHHHARGAWSPAGAIATDDILPAVDTVLVTRANVARVNLGELTLTTDTASTPQTRVQYRTVDVRVAGRRTTLARATLMARKTFDDRRNTKTFKAGIGNAGVVALAPTVAMVFARGHADPAGTHVSLGTALGTRLLGHGVSDKSGKSERRNRGSRLQKASTIAGARQPASHQVESIMFHQQLSTTNRAATSS